MQALGEPCVSANPNFDFAESLRLRMDQLTGDGFGCSPLSSPEISPDLGPIELEQIPDFPLLNATPKPETAPIEPATALRTAYSQLHRRPQNPGTSKWMELFPFRLKFNSAFRQSWPYKPGS